MKAKIKTFFSPLVVGILIGVFFTATASFAAYTLIIKPKLYPPLLRLFLSLLPLYPPKLQRRRAQTIRSTAPFLGSLALKKLPIPKFWSSLSPLLPLNIPEDIPLQTWEPIGSVNSLVVPTY